MLSVRATPIPMRRWPLALAVVLGTVVLGTLTSPRLARAQEPGGDGARPPTGEVLTYYGLRKLELDANVPDEEKAREWEAFIKRTAEQTAYAKQAIARWRDAGRVRAVEAAQQLDGMDAGAGDKIEAWRKVVAQFPRTPEARAAEKRIVFWRTSEAKRLSLIAAEVEKSRATKVERINAWRTVLDFAPPGSERRGADKRIAALQTQLYKEAEDLDRIPRVEAETKLAAWRDVLAGLPTPAQRKVAEQRMAALQGAR